MKTCCSRENRNINFWTFTSRLQFALLDGEMKNMPHKCQERADQSIEQSNNQSIARSMNRAIQSIDQSISKPINRSINQSIKRLINMLQRSKVAAVGRDASMTNQRTKKKHVIQRGNQTLTSGLLHQECIFIRLMAGCESGTRTNCSYTYM